MPPSKKRRGSSESSMFDVKKAHDDAVQYEVPEVIFMNRKLQTFIEAKAKKLGVLPSMLLPSLLTSTSNVMNMAEFVVSDGFIVNPNLFVLCVANKGAGKTPAGKVCLDPLSALERKEKVEFDKNEIAGKKRKKDEDEDEEEIDEDSDDEDYDDKNDKEPNVKKGRNSSGDDEADGMERQMFHCKQRVVDSITPEALFLSLYFGSGVLMIRSDEFKGFYDKYVIGAQNASALCSAFSGEPINYTTVKRGGLTIYKNRLTIFGSIQPGPLMDMVNGSGGTATDYQGFWDRFILIPSSEDREVDFEEQLQKMKDEDKFDVERYLNIINEQHKKPRSYTCDDLALEEVKRVKGELKLIDEASDYGNETTGMTSKAFTNTMKLSPIYACGRQVVNLMEAPLQDGALIDFQVTAEDIKAAWELMKFSMSAFQKYKTSIGEELSKEPIENEEKLMTDEEIGEDVIIAGLLKIVRIYERAKNGKILLSILKRDSLFPKGARLDLSVFVKALEKYGIGLCVNVTSGNKFKSEALQLTMKTESPEVLRIFQLMWERAKVSGISFDPLKVFEK